MSKGYPGWENFNPVDHVAARVPAPRRKYGNVPTVHDGVRFDSKKEADRYVDLRMMQAGGVISELEIQPKFPLHVVNPHGIKVEIGVFTPDFRYRQDGAIIVEDVKSPATRGETAYRMRKRHVEAEYQIEIREV